MSLLSSATNSAPPAAATPAFTAAANPRFVGSATTSTPSPRTAPAVPSVEPLSTTITEKSR